MSTRDPRDGRDWACSQLQISAPPELASAEPRTSVGAAPSCSSLDSRDRPACRGTPRRNAAQHVATRCDMLQRGATCCNALQHVATQRYNTVQHAHNVSTQQTTFQTQRNTLQCSTPCCNTAQNVATQRNSVTGTHTAETALALPHRPKRLSISFDQTDDVELTSAARRRAECGDGGEYVAAHLADMRW